MIVALAGRRIDAPDAQTPRFPLANASLVRERIREVLIELGANTLICSAAAGADLLALEAAASLGLRRRVVLPYGRDQFLENSVRDRPGDWEWSFNRAYSDARGQGTLRSLRLIGTPHEAYLRATHVILDDAQELAAAEPRSGRQPGAGKVTAVIVWDGSPRDHDDLTAHFADEARRRGLPVREILTR
jgi:hypothetical protein